MSNKAPLSTRLCAKITLLLEEENLSYNEMVFLINVLLPEYLKKYSKIKLDDQQRTELKLLSAGVRNDD